MQKKAKKSYQGFKKTDAAENYAFISYSSRKVQEVEQIVRFLREKGIACWMAPRSIPGGSNYLKEIPHAIENCSLFLLILSEEAQQSTWVTSELESAKNYRKDIIPFQIDNCRLETEFRFMLSHNQIIPACGRADQACEELARQICQKWGLVYPEEKKTQLSRNTGITGLESLICQRLTADPENRKRIQDFRCDRNPNMMYYLKYQAWQNDSDGSNAIYLIKNPEGQVLMYFSMKCGMLYEQMPDLNMDKDKRTLTLLLGREKKDPSEEEKAHIRQLLDEYSGDMDRLIWDLRTKIHESKQRKQMWQTEWQTEPAYSAGVRGILAAQTYPAVELIHMCMNDNARDVCSQLRKQLGVNGSLSEIFYWHFVVPMLEKMQNVAGCQYVYTYVADDSIDGRLTRFFREKLNFSRNDSECYIKPQYDFACSFLYQQISTLLESREKFFGELRKQHVG